jgi:chemotaxis response regulator CheB
VLVVTATVSGNYELVCEALGHGAYDAVCTPTLGDRSPQEAGANLLAKLKSVDGIRQDLKTGLSSPGPANDAPASTQATWSDHGPLVALGASTGGPQALEKIISSWPASFPAAVVVVQHIAADFAGSLAQWLHDRSQLEVRPVSPGDSPRRGTVLVAATNDHLVMRNDRRLIYRAQPVDSPYRPSVDVLFDSLVENWHSPSVAVVLTGIGRDGAKGLLKLRQRGWHTLSQDEHTSVVYGMPQAAAEIGAAKRILALDDMAAHIAGHVSRLSDCQRRS